MVKFSILITCMFTSIFCAPTRDRICHSIFLNNNKIGYQIITRMEKCDTVITSIKEYTRVKRGKYGELLATQNDMTVFETNKGKPLSFTLTYSENNIVRTSKGHFTNSAIVNIHQTSGNEKKSFTLPWNENSVFFEGIRLKYQSGPPVPGNSDTFSTVSMSDLCLQSVSRTVLSKEAVLIGSKTDSLFRVESVIKTPQYTTKLVSYVNDTWQEKKILQSQGKMQIMMIECPFDSVKTGLSEYDILAATSIKAPAGISPYYYNSSIYKLSVPGDLNIPSSDEQKLVHNEGNIITLKISKHPISRDLVYPLHDISSDKEIYLQPSRYIECNDSLIKSLAQQAVGKTKRAKRALKRIQRFVRFNIYPSLNIGYATALETARNEEGDCTEFALLTTALCRAANIPARVVNGIAYVPFVGKFYFHAWTQVFIDNNWVSIDAAMGKFDPGHIALSFSTDGSPQANVADFIGNIKIIRIDTE